MSEALVKGETHLSEKDKQSLMELDLSEFDAVFREGHDNDYFERDLDSVYALFAIGSLVYGATYNRLYFSIDDFREKAKREDVPVYDEIDAAIYETYEMVPRWKRVGLLFLSPFFALIGLGLIVQPVNWILERIAPNIIPLLAYTGVFLLLIFFGFAWALAYFLLIEGQVMYDRDEEMAEEIIEIVEEQEYEYILVSCGGNHRPGIASYLRSEGWDVEEELTESYIGKGLLWFDRIKAAILNPKETLRTLKSKLRRQS